jgi:hypothetical protein
MHITLGEAALAFHIHYIAWPSIVCMVLHKFSLAECKIFQELLQLLYTACFPIIKN